MPLSHAFSACLSSFQELSQDDSQADAPPPPPRFRKTYSLDAEPFEGRFLQARARKVEELTFPEALRMLWQITNWASDHRLELPFEDPANPVFRWKLRCWSSSCSGPAYIYSPDYTRDVAGGKASPCLVLQRPHKDPNDEPQPLLQVLDHYKLMDIDCSTDGVLTPFCNICMKLEPVAMCDDQNICQPSVNHFTIRTTCPRPKYLTESDGNVFFAPQSDGDEQRWRLSEPLGASPPQQSFDFL
ncbi:unnamed protein product [Symbiodinium natans]|uniref:Uncharacterized protein n=1 Tax=Symbiodinium natans TaxID=878477 RepID=A0A812VE35_9DINO|nr:unnamed protein product [Symbiodinium natans]